MDAKLRIAEWKERKPRLSPDEIRLVFEGRKAVSLWDMIVILAVDGVRWVTNLYFQAHQTGQPNETPNEDAKNNLRRYLLPAKQFCERMDLPNALSRFNIFLNDTLPHNSCTWNVVENEIWAMVDVVFQELSERKLVFIPRHLLEFLEQEKLFGEAVYDKFPSARSDIKDAGNCLAADLNTAAVFHLMRVVEIGLRAMAQHLQVPIKKQQLEYLQWNSLIERIRAKIKIKTSKLTPATPKKAEALEFYNGTMGQFEGFKDEFRNNVMHTRTHYDEHKAISVFLNVKGFMQRLAVRVRGPECE
jgi:hypothetical protein